MREALQIYERALAGSGVQTATRGAHVRFDDGSRLPFPVARYLGRADRHDRRLLDGLQGPVLDVGCGPGRHLRALTAQGVYALGVDLSPMAVALARIGGAQAIVGDVFGEVPGAGIWRTALLLDGNIGIGGQPLRLLERLCGLMHPGGVVLAELGPPGSGTGEARARLETDGESSGWFPWARVAAGELGGLASASGLVIEREWTCGGRWFARLRSGTCD